MEQTFAITYYNNSLKQQICELWEKSVLATHHFLSASDFQEIKALVWAIDFEDFEVYCLMREQTLLGFVGVLDNKIEMLFIDPSYFHQGFGKKLTDFAVHELDATMVDVNEQNKAAFRFYQKYGFQIVERHNTDGQGKAYPLLSMRINT